MQVSAPPLHLSDLPSIGSSQTGLRAPDAGVAAPDHPRDPLATRAEKVRPARRRRRVAPTERQARLIRASAGRRRAPRRRHRRHRRPGPRPGSRDRRLRGVADRLLLGTGMVAVRHRGWVVPLTVADDIAAWGQARLPSYTAGRTRRDHPAAGDARPQEIQVRVVRETRAARRSNRLPGRAGLGALRLHRRGAAAPVGDPTDRHSPRPARATKIYVLQPTVGSRITRSAWRVIELKSTVCRPGRSIAQVCTPSAGGTVEMSTV